MDKRKIVIVDSEKNILFTYQTILAENYQVMVANSTQEAIKLLTKHSIDILITEFYLKGLNTLDFISEVRKRNPDIYIIMLTSVAISTENYQRIIASGVQDCFIKPFSINKLIVTIKKGLKIRSLIRENMYLEKKINTIEKFFLNTKPQLCDKHFFLKETRQELERAKRYLTSFSIILLENNLNNRYEFQYWGDLIDNTLLSKLRHSDIITRFNGSYGFLLPETKKGGIANLCKRLHQGISTLTLQNNGSSYKDFAHEMIFISASYPEETDKVMKIIKNLETNQSYNSLNVTQ